MEQGQPKYRQLKELILSWIVSGKYKPHDKLPSENEIGKQYEMSRQTVRQAFGDMEQEGWLYRVQGKGTFVADQSVAGRRMNAQSMSIGLITTYISDYIFPTIVRGVESSLRDRGIHLLLASTNNEKDKEQGSLESMLHEPLAGLIIEPTKSAEGNPSFHYFLALEAKGIPYVMLNERYSDVDAPCLRMDDELGGSLAVKHLIELGHRRIAGLFKTDDFQGVHRMRGFMKAHREQGWAVPGDYLVRYVTEEKETKPLDMLAELLQREPEERPTAVVCYNDELAVKCLDVIRQSGLAVPQQLSIVGFDDSNLATATEVKLTTLAHPKTEMGEAAVSMLLEMIEKGSRPADKVYEPKLIVRESTAKV